MAGPVPVWTFRPRVVAVSSAAMALSSVAVFTVIAVRLPASSRATFTVFQRLTLLAIAIAVLGILFRMATVRVVAYDDGLAVRNVFGAYRIGWDRIRAVRFSPGDPWLMVFDAEGNRRGVLAIQASDGPRSRTAAARLATIARAHGAGPAQPA